MIAPPPRPCERVATIQITLRQDFADRLSAAPIHH
jgi:hypothetical protein